MRDPENIELTKIRPKIQIRHEIGKVQAIINNIYDGIQLTIEMENAKGRPFLDAMIRRTAN